MMMTVVVVVGFICKLNGVYIIKQRGNFCTFVMEIN